MDFQKVAVKGILAAAIVIMGLGVTSVAQDAGSPQADNTKVNRQDSDQSRVTSDQQE